jgi:hypothetical protein
MPDLLLCDADIGVFNYVMNVETVVDTVTANEIVVVIFTVYLERGGT